jgi:hypothetical protein
LTTQDILRLLKGIVSWSLRPSLDLIKSRRNVGWGFGLGADRVKVGCSSVLALWQRNILMTGALDDGKRNKFAGHFPGNIPDQLHLMPIQQRWRYH